MSNFQVDHLERLASETDVVPAVNQIELHPYFQNREVAAYGEEHGIATEAWAPIAQGNVLDDPEVEEIAEKLGRTPAQVVLRWHIEDGRIVFPKSVTPERISENFELFDFELEPGDMPESTRWTAARTGAAARTRRNSSTRASRRRSGGRAARRAPVRSGSKTHVTALGR